MVDITEALTKPGKPNGACQHMVNLRGGSCEGGSCEGGSSEGDSAGNVGESLEYEDI